MRAAQLHEPISFTSRANNRADAVAVLGEIVAQLAERVELLETRERIGRAAVCASQSRHRKSP